MTDECAKAFDEWERSFINTPKERKTKWYKSAIRYAEAGWKSGWDAALEHRNKHSDIAGSSSGRTPDFESGNDGSTPSPASNNMATQNPND